MLWRRLGRIFEPKIVEPWAASHAAVPTVRALGAGRFRVFYSSRDAARRSHIGWFEFDVARPNEILAESREAVLGPGAAGCHDDSGTMCCCVAEADGEIRHYYIGWNLGATVPFRVSIGMAVEQVDGSLQRFSQGPLMDRSIHDPCFVTGPNVLRLDGMWNMWYTSGLAWRDGRHYYHVKHARSRDGIAWERAGTVAIDFRDGGEYAIARPFVVADRDRLRMWYCSRGPAYRIGYAESDDGLRWTRKDSEMEWTGPAGDWEAEMQCYPCVFDHAGQRYMLYNGDGYGRTGIGLAVLEQE